MTKYYLGVDIGSISTKGVVIDQHAKILASEYLWTEGNPIRAVKNVIGALSRALSPKIRVDAVGTTGSARRLAGVMLDAAVVKNEITAHAIGTLCVEPAVKTIFEIGGQDSKIIILDDGIVVDYAMNTLCAAGTGSFLSSQAKRLGVQVEDFGRLALTATNPVVIAARCTVFAESDLVHKTQMGYAKQDIIAGLCSAVATNFYNNLAKGKKIRAPIVFQGGVSKNAGVVKAFEQITGEKITVFEHAHLMGALGAAVLARDSAICKPFDFSSINCEFVSRGIPCRKCANNCELVAIYRDSKLVDTWGRRCES